jgi:hypothetical protein
VSCGYESHHDVMHVVGHMDVRETLRLDVVLDQSVRAHMTSISVTTDLRRNRYGAKTVGQKHRNVRDISPL